MKIAFVFNQQRENSVEQGEFDTLETVEAISSALACKGDTVIPVEMTTDGSWIQALRRSAPDLAFNTAEGFFGVGRESLAPIVFEQLKLPYVGSGPYGCFLTLDKFLTKQVVASRGVSTPHSFFVSSLAELEAIADETSYPVFVKPNFEGSSKGITRRSRCANLAELKTYVDECLAEFPEGILIEAYIEGKDVTVPYIAGLGDDGVLEPIEYSGPRTDGFWIYDYQLKNELDDQVGVLCPAHIPSYASTQIKAAMKQCVQALAVTDMGRADFRVTPTGEVYFIEFNALPSLQPGAGIFAASAILGLDYDETIQAIVAAAIERRKIKRVRGRPKRKLRARKPNLALVYNLQRKSHSDHDFELEAEFDSQETVDHLAAAIRANGHAVVPMEATKELSTHLLDENIDVVFNIAEGSNRRGREAQVPAVCDLLGIEHTGNDATCLAVTMDKALTTRLLSTEGIDVPRSQVFQRRPKKIKHDLTYPLIVKPNVEGTSKGVYDSSVVHDEVQLLAAMDRLSSSSISNILVEEYIQGREFTAGVLEYPRLEVLGPTEIEFKPGKPFPVYSFEAKQLENQLDNEHFRMVCPAEIADTALRRVRQFAKKCFRAVGARDVARVDFRMRDDGMLFFVEINPLPGLTPGYSDLTIMSERTGVSYEELIRRILNPAIARWRKTF